ELREAQPAGRETVEVGSMNLAAVAAEVREANVIGQDDDNVGSRAARTVFFPSIGATVRDAQTSYDHAHQRQIPLHLTPPQEIRPPWPPSLPGVEPCDRHGSHCKKWFSKGTEPKTTTPGGPRR